MSEIQFWSSEGLIAHLRELHELINVQECFGTQDLALYYAIINELDRRGYITGSLTV